MKKLLIILFISLINIINSQEEKRLALVIGNANYEKGALKNPVNDALLMKQTLEKLNFDVIYATNLELDRDMKSKIREFGEKRAEYDIGFVYYAGHGVQVKGDNYLLPTKENFNCEDDVLEYGINVQIIMKHLKSTSNSINILVLDACRNNPLKGNNCPNSSRSLNNEGLAKIVAPTGSLISFSTSANTTASDGVGKNSLFCQSLAMNLMKPDKTLNQIFQDVRSDVLRESKKTGRVQEPEEASKLIGDYYFIKTERLDFAEKIISGEIDENDLIKMYGNKEVKSPISYYYKLGQSFFDEKKYDKAIENYEQAQKLGLIDSLNNLSKVDDLDKFLYSESGLFYSKLAISYESLNNFNKAIDNYSIAINILEKTQKSNFSEDSLNRLNDSYLNDIEYLHLKRGELFLTKKYYVAAKNDFNKANSSRAKLKLAMLAIEESEYESAKRYTKHIISELEPYRNSDNVSLNQNQQLIKMYGNQMSQAYLLKAVIKDRKYLNRNISQFKTSNPIFRRINSNRKKTYKYYGKGRKHIEKALEYDSNNVDILFHKIYWIENRINWKNRSKSKPEIVRLADEILDISNNENKIARAVSKKIANSLKPIDYFNGSPSSYIEAIRILNEELIKNENDTSILYLRATLSREVYNELFLFYGLGRKYYFDAEKIPMNSNLKRKDFNTTSDDVESLAIFFLNDSLNTFRNPLTTRGNNESIVDENGFFLIDSIFTPEYSLFQKTEIMNVENFNFTHKDDYRKACYLGHPTACNFLNFDNFKEIRSKRYENLPSKLVFKGVIGTNKLFYDINWNLCEKENAKYFRVVTLDSNLNPVGLVKDYYMDGSLQGQGNFKVLKPNVNVEIYDGEMKYYYENGLLKKRVYYINGKFDHNIECRNYKGEIIACEERSTKGFRNDLKTKKK